MTVAAEFSIPAIFGEFLLGSLVLTPMLTPRRPQKPVGAPESVEPRRGASRAPRARREALGPVPGAIASGAVVRMCIGAAPEPIPATNAAHASGRLRAPRSSIGRRAGRSGALRPSPAPSTPNPGGAS